MRILITGVAGFIGSNLADYLLRKGHKIIGIDDLSYGLLEQVPSGVEFHKLSILNNEIYPLFNNVEIVFHLAAKNCIADCQLDPVETARINVCGTVNIFEAGKQAGVKKTIYQNIISTQVAVGIMRSTFENEVTNTLLDSSIGYTIEISMGVIFPYWDAMSIQFVTGYDLNGIKNQDDEELLNSPFVGIGIQILGDWF